MAVLRVSLLVVHGIGILFTLWSLFWVWLFRLVLRLLAGAFGLGILAWPIMAGLVAVLILGIREFVRTFRRRRRGEPEPDAALRLRAAAYVAVGTPFFIVLFLSGSSVAGRPDTVQYPFLAYIVGTYAYGAYLFWSLRIDRFRRRFSPRFRKTLDMAGMNFTLLLVCLEIGLRVVAVISPTQLLVTDNSPSQVRRSAGVMPAGSLHLGFPVNSRGAYDRELDLSALPDTLVVSIGDSFSYGAVHHAYHYSTVAESMLPGVEFYNIGFGGIGVTDYTYLLEFDALPLDPDLVVVQLFLGNDVGEGADPLGPLRWYDGDRYLTSVVWRRLSILREEDRLTLAEGIRDVTPGSDGDGIPGALTAEEAAVQYPWINDPLAEQPNISRDLFLQLELLRALQISLPDNEVSADLYGLFFSQLRELVRAAADVPLAFVLIPDEFQVEDDLWEEVVRMSGRELDRDLAQRRITEWMADEGLPVLDLLPVFRSVEPLSDGRRHVYHLQDTHLNARGNEVAGKALAVFADEVMKNPPAFTLNLTTDRSSSESESGWHAPESDGDRTYAWSNGVRTTFEVPRRRGENLAMRLEGTPIAFPNQPPLTVTVFINGTNVGNLQMASGLAEYVVDVPDGVLDENVNTVELQYAYSIRPVEFTSDSNDSRPLAVAWYSISVGGRNR